MHIGGNYLENGVCEFTVWAPFARQVEVQLTSPDERILPLHPLPRGYWRASAQNIAPGTLYRYTLSPGESFPDPASHFQPQGVHGPSQIVDHASFAWDDQAYRPVDLAELVLYELHVGTFTSEGTFTAVIPRIDELKALGVTALEIMPVSQFPGERNWGYDGCYPYAPQNSYGGPEGLKLLVNECHKRGMAVFLDVVYNHFGPEGNYSQEFGPYVTDKYKTPWGNAINFDDEHSDEVRNYFIQNALHWFGRYHLDGLRLDAVHSIYDMSATPFLRELALAVKYYAKHSRRQCCLIAESDLNDVKIIRPEPVGGYGLDAQWCDDYHHALHALLTGERQGYYRDFGSVTHFARSYNEGFSYAGHYSPYRKRSYGNSSLSVPPYHFVVFSQNHDQAGNRMQGERLSVLAPFEALKLAAGAVLLSPYLPLLFMGEEYGETAPFLYFVHHSDDKLVQAVRAGRQAEFREFGFTERFPDPQGEEAFCASKIEWEKRRSGRHALIAAYYRELLRLRRIVPALSHAAAHSREAIACERENIVIAQRCRGQHRTCAILNFNRDDVLMLLPFAKGTWKKLLDSSEEKWQGPGALLPEFINADGSVQSEIRALSIALYEKEGGYYE